MSKVTYEDVKTRIKMVDILGRYGLELDKSNNMACPIHGGDNKTGFGVHDRGYKWTCRTRECGKASSNIDFVALKEGISHQEAFIMLKDMFNMQDEEPIKATPKPKKKQVGEAIFYDYVDDQGELKYQIKRIAFDDGSKKFSPIMPNGDYKCAKEDRVLYNLSQVADNGDDYIIMTEGEKTADAVIGCGFIGTTFPFGCGSWDESYIPYLSGKKIVFMPDADEAGEKWLKEVSESLAGHVESTLTISIPDSFVVDNPQFKGHDFADFYEINGRDDSLAFISDAIEGGLFADRGIDRSSLNIVTDLCKERFKELENGAGGGIFNLSRIFGPEMNIDVMEGDVIMVIAPSGVGKTRILHNFPIVFDELNFMVFDLELTPKILAQRYIAMENGIAFKYVPDRIQCGREVKLPIIENVFLPKKGSLTVEKIKDEVDRVEMITGRRIDVIAIDYIAKMNRLGGATESIEAHASMFKNYCADEGRVGIITTQRSRLPQDKKADSDYIMPSKEDAIHSSALEQSVQEAMCFCLKSEHEREVLLCSCDKYTHGEMPHKTVELMADNLSIKYVGINQPKEEMEW